MSEDTGNRTLTTQCIRHNSRSGMHATTSAVQLNFATIVMPTLHATQRHESMPPDIPTGKPHLISRVPLIPTDVSRPATTYPVEQDRCILCQPAWCHLL